MRYRNYFWAIALILVGCTSLFRRESDFERGLEAYRSKKYAEAAANFKVHHSKHPESDSSLYYLFNCYGYLNKHEEQISVLEQLRNREVNDLNVYLNLIYYYRKYERFNDLYVLLSECPSSMVDNLDRQIVLAREFFAEIICGAMTKKLTTDPMIYSISRGYLPVFPDGQLYAEDTLTNANLIILLDRLIEPQYPRNFYPMKNISTKSYLYLPYMRLVDSGILKFDPYLVPSDQARILTAVSAVKVLVERGLLD
jgi:tetratricopeptide (TPR) repeat protein